MNSDLLARACTTVQPASLSSAGLDIIERLFDHVPDTAFFVKDIRGRYLAVNHSLVERCGLQEKRQLIGLHVRDIFPKELAEMYASQDQTVLSTGRPITDHLELHWYARRLPGWCLTTKLPMRNAREEVIGLAGISRDLRAPGDSGSIPRKLASTLEYLESHFQDSVSPGSLARLAGLPPVRFARLVKRIFRLTPNQLITQTRLAAAAQLLVETDRSVAEVACACGFYDHSALTRAFRSATQLTPSEFRKLRKTAIPARKS